MQHGACWRACIPGRGLALFLRGDAQQFVSRPDPVTITAAPGRPSHLRVAEFASRREKRSRAPRLGRRRA